MQHLNPVQRNFRDIQHQILDSLEKHAHPDHDIIRVSTPAFQFMFHTESNNSHMRVLRVGNKEYTVVSYPSWDITAHSSSRMHRTYIDPILIPIEYELPKMLSYEMSLLDICKRPLLRELSNNFWVFSEPQFSLSSQVSVYSKASVSLIPLLVCAMNEFLWNGFVCESASGKGVPALYEKVRGEDCTYFNADDSILEKRTLPFYITRLHLAQFVRKNFDVSISRDAFRKNFIGK